MKPLFYVLLLSVAATIHAQVVTKGLILDLDADKGVEVEDGDRVVKWTNQVAAFAAKDFLKRDQGRREPGSGRPTLKKSVAAVGGHNTLVFKRQELVNHEEDAFDHLLTGSGYTWLAVISVHKQVVQLKDVNSFFGNLRNGGNYEGIWGNLTDDNRVWIGSRNGITFGRWDDNNPMVLAPEPLQQNRYHVVAGRMGAGTGAVAQGKRLRDPPVAARQAGQPVGEVHAGAGHCRRHAVQLVGSEDAAVTEAERGGGGDCKGGGISFVRQRCKATRCELAEETARRRLPL